MSENPDFLALVLDWLRAWDIDAGTVQHVVPFGTDWAGGTESGFYDEFKVTIEYTTTRGRQCYWDVTGQDMESLWMLAVKGWPEVNV